MWEIYSGAARPYNDLTNAAVPGEVSQGRRLTRPRRCAPALWSVVAMCFDADPAARPSLSSLEAAAQNEINHLQRTSRA